MTFTWQYLETGDCPRCERPAFLYTHSAINIIDNLRGTDGTGFRYISNNNSFDYAMCIDCHRHYAREAVSYLDDVNIGNQFWNSLVDNYPEPGFLRDGSAIEGVQTCFVCSKPETLTHRFRDAFIANNRTIIVQVHKSCSMTTPCCGTEVIFHGRWGVNNPNITSNSALGMIFNIEGIEYCVLCRDELMTDREHSWSDYRNCEWCNEFYNRETMERMNGSVYCYDCYNNEGRYCENCDVSYMGDNHYCPDDDDEYSDGVIHDYSYKPSPYFFSAPTEKKQRLFFGIELEVENTSGSRRDNAEFVQEKFGGRIYIKSDGSLDNGFEIVTHPHTLDAYKKDFRWDLFSQLRRRGLRSWDTDTCGLHVHVSRDAFGSIEKPSRTYWEDPTQFESYISSRQYHEFRFIKLIYDNERQICRLAGRTSSYASFADKGNIMRKVKDGYQSEGHYSAVNTDNENTIEVRVFKGSLIPSRVLSAIELVHAGVEYTRDLKVSGKNKALSWIAFAGYVHTHMDKYENLHRYMTQSLQQDNIIE